MVDEFTLTREEFLEATNLASKNNEEMYLLSKHIMKKFKNIKDSMERDGVPEKILAAAIQTTLEAQLGSLVLNFTGSPKAAKSVLQRVIMLIDKGEEPDVL